MIDANAEKRLKVVLLPSNPSHLATQLPVAERLVQLGHQVVFVTRDSKVYPEYRVEHLLHGLQYEFLSYSGAYSSDYGRIFPDLISFFIFKSGVQDCLRLLSADVLVLCNDSAALFDRVFADCFYRYGKQVCLIQESVRPAKRTLGFLTKYREWGVRQLVVDAVEKIATSLGAGPYFRKEYGKSKLNCIFAAGEMYKTRLVEEGVDPARIFVTGQPRLDRHAEPVTHASEPKIDSQRTLLFCSQPVKCLQKTLDRMFVDLVSSVDSMDSARLLVKLHPRDLDEEHWYGLLKRAGIGKNLISISKDIPLQRCFEMVDAFVTISSTTCLEAMQFGLPVALINYLPIEWYLPYADTNAVLSIDRRSDLKANLSSILFDATTRRNIVKASMSVLARELYLCDGCSASRIANHIIELANGDSR